MPAPARKTKSKTVARGRALEALYEMRSRGTSLREAARANHTTPATVRKYVPRALERTRGGRWAATKSDRYVRRMNFLTTEDSIELSVRGSRTASTIAEHAAAVHNFLTGKPNDLKRFKNKSITAGNVQYPFITDPRTLRLLQERGVVQYEELYVSL